MIRRESFKIITCQLSPVIPFNILQFTKNLGRPKNKCKLIKELRSKYDEPIQELIPEMDKWIHQTCVVYVNKIMETSYSSDSTEDLFTNFHEIVDEIYQMTVALYEMGLPCLDDSEIRLRYTSDDDPCEVYPSAYEKFKKFGSYTLTDDLVTSIKLVELLDADSILLH
jgi:hypothetical protein